MQITIDTDTMSVDELQFLLECLQQDIKMKGGASAPPPERSNPSNLVTFEFHYDGAALKGRKSKGSKPYLAVLSKSPGSSKYAYEFLKLDPECDKMGFSYPAGTTLRGRTILNGTQYYFKVLEHGLSGGRIKDYDL